jgi:CubicO group peptidase (beta-lactamase class C family)
MAIFVAGHSTANAQNCWAPQQGNLGGGTSLGPSLTVFQNKLYAAWKGVGDDKRMFWSSFDGRAWAPQQGNLGGGTSHGPSLAVFQDKLYAAWKGEGDDKRMFWSFFDGKTWSPQQGNLGGGTSHGPSLAVFQNKLYAAWKGEGTDPRMFWSFFDGKTWSPQQGNLGGGTSHGPSLAVFQNKLYAAWKGVGDDKRMFWATFDGTAWAPQQAALGGGTSHGPKLAVFQNKLYAMWKGEGTDQRIFWSTLEGDGPWSWQQEALSRGSSAGPSLAAFQNRLYAAWKGPDPEQIMWWSSIGTEVLPTCLANYDNMAAAFKTWIGANGVTNAQITNGTRDTGFGVTKPEDPVPLASLSKAITGLCIAKLVDAGSLSYTDTLATRLKDYLAANKPLDPAAGKITIAELLRHTSGLGTFGRASGTKPYDPVQGYNATAIPNDATADVKFANLSLAQTIGAKYYAYNDVNYALLGMIIKAVTPDHSYESYCKKALFTDPLFAGRYAIPKIGAGTQVMGAFGGWEMSTMQYYLLISTHFRKLSPKAEQFMKDSETIKGSDGNLVQYGLGVGVFKTAGGRRIQHYGNWNGPTTPPQFSSFFVMYDNGQIVVAATPDKNVLGVTKALPAAQTAIENALGTALH